MTFVDTLDLRDRACGKCGAICYDRLLHARWHDALDTRLNAFAQAHEQTLRVLQAITVTPAAPPDVGEVEP